MNTRETSKESLEWAHEFGKIATKRAIIIDCVRNNPEGLTRSEISIKTNIPINVITPRVHELIEEGYLFEYGTKTQKNGRSAMVIMYA